MHEIERTKQGENYRNYPLKLCFLKSNWSSGFIFGTPSLYERVVEAGGLVEHPEIWLKGRVGDFYLESGRCQKREGYP